LYEGLSRRIDWRIISAKGALDVSCACSRGVSCAGTQNLPFLLNVGAAVEDDTKEGALVRCSSPRSLPSRFKSSLPEIDLSGASPVLSLGRVRNGNGACTGSKSRLDCAGGCAGGRAG